MHAVIEMQQLGNFGKCIPFPTHTHTHITHRKKKRRENKKNDNTKATRLGMFGRQGARNGPRSSAAHFTTITFAWLDTHNTAQS